MNCAARLEHRASEREHNTSPLLADLYGFLCLTESGTGLLLSVKMLFQVLCLHILLILFSFTPPPPVSPLIYYFTHLSHSDQTQEIPGAARFFLNWSCHLE